MVYRFFDKNPSGCVVKNESMSSQELAEELHKAIIRKVGKRKMILLCFNHVTLRCTKQKWPG